MVLPPSGSVVRRSPSLPRVPRVGSPASQVLRERCDFPSLIPPRFVSFAQWYRGGAPPFALTGGRAPSACEPGPLVAGGPSGVMLAEIRRDLPGSWSVLPCMPRSWTPGGSPRLARRGVSILPSAVLKASAPPANLLSRLDHAACTIAVYASQPGSPQLHARLASDWWPTFVGQDSHLQD